MQPLERPRAGSKHAHSSLQDLAAHADEASKKQLPCLLYVDLQHPGSSQQGRAPVKRTRSTSSAHEIRQHGYIYILLGTSCSCMRPHWFLLLLRIFQDHACVYYVRAYICTHLNDSEHDSNNLELESSVAWADLQYGPAAGCKSLSFHKMLILDLPELAHQLFSIAGGSFDVQQMRGSRLPLYSLFKHTSDFSSSKSSFSCLPPPPFFFLFLLSVKHSRSKVRAIYIP